MIRLVSISGGKDSTATGLLALEQYPDETMFVTADTGNEHELTYEYIDYLREKFGKPIHVVKADFSDRWPRRIDYVRNKWPEKGVPDEVIQSALSALELGPTGIPFLDLCILKGRFPSSKAPFCTQELKIYPLTNYSLDLIDQYGPVESWQGVRAEESSRRAKLPEREDKGGGLTIYRPIHKWTVPQVFEIHKKHWVKPNPLYSLDCDRVGCMFCINAKKKEILSVFKRFPHHVQKIHEWEKTVTKASKRQSSTFFYSGPETNFENGNVYKVIEWSQTQHGGSKIDFFSIFEEPSACSSSYGLCE